MSRERQKRLTNPGHPKITLHVLGAAGDVTGSLNLFEYFDGVKTTRFLLDVGLHQGNEAVNRQKRLPRGITADMIDFVVISHAHIDHSGWLPKLISDGFKGYAYTHAATLDLMRFLLPDSGHLQEAAAERRNRYALKRGFKSPNVVPMYGTADAKSSLSRVKTVEYDRQYTLSDGISVKFTEACHILGAAVVTLTFGSGKNKKVVCFTGNIGRPNTAVLKDLAAVAQADYVISESTYGDKLHDERDRLETLAGIINRAYARAMKPHPQYGHGVIVIPAFAVGRVQAVLYDLRLLMEQKRIPNIPVFLDSPMAIEATRVYRKHRGLYNQEAADIVARGLDPFTPPQYVEVDDAKKSLALDAPTRKPIIIIGSSGMAAGGRILAHIEYRLAGKQNTVLFVGHQEPGALGYELVNGASVVRIRGRKTTVNATIELLSDYSGHADYSEIVSWLGKFTRKPKRTFLVHGEPESLANLKSHIESDLGWSVTVPTPRQKFVLS